MLDADVRVVMGGGQWQVFHAALLLGSQRTCCVLWPPPATLDCFPSGHTLCRVRCSKSELSMVFPLLSPGLFPAWRPPSQGGSVVPAVLAPDVQRVFRFVTAMHRHVQQKHSWHAKLLCGAYFEQLRLQVRLHLCFAQSMAQFKKFICFHMCCDCLVHTWSFKCR